jgi:hypothetical protein
MGKSLEILGEEIVHKSGCYSRVRRWVRGVHPELGVIVRGYTGWETMQELDVIKAMGSVYVTPDVLPVPVKSEENTEVCPEHRNVA